MAAGITVDALVSVRSNGPKTLTLFGERTANVKILRLGPWVKDRILLTDLGYYSHRHFAKIRGNGGYFVSRHKANADPHFVRSLTVHRGRAIELEGKRLSEVLPKLERGVLDAEVELSFARRVYGGKRSSDTLTCRLAAVWDELHAEYHRHVTNLGPEVLSAEEVAKLYPMRREIELVFKELKSHYALDQVRTTNPDVVEALVWSALLTLVVSRRLHNLVRARAPLELRARYTQMRWAGEFREVGDSIFRCLLAYLGYDEATEGDRYRISYRLTEAALDPHVNRHRFREEFSA